jgi:selenocysteine-specific elongation factor
VDTAPAGRREESVAVAASAADVSTAEANLTERILADVLERLRRRQAERPWLMGLTSLGLATALSLPEPALIRILAPFVGSARLALRSGYYSTPDFSPRLNVEQQAFFDAAFAAEAGCAPMPQGFTDLRLRIKSSPVPELRQAFETLIASGALSKVGDFVYLGSHLAAIRAQLETALERQPGLTVAQFRTLIGTSRKFAVPLLEFFDATGVTLRNGDERVLRPSAPKMEIAAEDSEML